LDAKANSIAIEIMIASTAIFPLFFVFLDCIPNRLIKSLNEEKQPPNINVELKECIALGDSFSRHAITKKS